MARSRPGGCYYLRSWKIGCYPISFALSKKNKLFSIVDKFSPSIETYNLIGQLVKKQTIPYQLDPLHIATSTTTICFYTEYYNSPHIEVRNIATMDLLKKWKLPIFCSCLVLEDDVIYVLGTCEILIYTLDGKLLHSIKLQSNEWIHRKIAIFENQIFMLNTRTSSITVFSLQGEVIRSWQTAEHLVVFCPGSITVTKLAVYVLNCAQKSILAFTHEGEILFNINHPEAHNFQDIFELEDLLYLPHGDKSKILVFVLI